MTFSKNISRLADLESEMIRLKGLYLKALKTKNDATVKALRNSIKSIKNKMLTSIQ